MSENQSIAQLNNLFINLDKSLLQYAGESSLWTAIDAEEEREIYNSLVARERSNCDDLMRIILNRRWNLAQSTYPTDYTDLHYISFEYLADKIAKNEEFLIGLIDENLKTFSDDEEIQPLLERIKADTKDNIEQLNKVASKQS